jgi:hypothetical protein
MKSDAGFEKEVSRHAGDAAEQRAKHAAQHIGGVYATNPEWSYKGMQPCYIVFQTADDVPDTDDTVYCEVDPNEVVRCDDFVECQA